mgnify:CR=1 FL=1
MGAPVLRHRLPGGARLLYGQLQGHVPVEEKQAAQKVFREKPPTDARGGARDSGDPPGRAPQARGVRKLALLPSGRCVSSRDIRGYKTMIFTMIILMYDCHHQKT